MNLADAALSYHARGWAPVVIKYATKRPVHDEWQLKRLDEQAIRREFNGTRRNIGIAMGPASNGLTDCDLDASEAVAVASFFLPRTGSIFGRPGSRASHWLYRTDLADKHPSAEISFSDPIATDNNRAKLCEIRIGGGGRGAQTIFPPSKHPCGETVGWEVDGKEAEVDGAALIDCMSLLAACALIARYWPNTGQRHHAAMVVGGFLARCGWTPARARVFLEAIGAVHIGGKDWPRTAEDVVLAHEQDRNVYGFPELENIFGAAVAKRVAEWLRFDPGKRRSNKSAKTPGTAAQKAKGPPPSPLELDRCLARDPHLADVASFDEFSGSLICNRPILHPDRPSAENFVPRPWRDEDDVALVEAFNSRGFPSAAKATAHDVIDLRARQLAQFHPVRAYLNSLRWDCRDRLSDWLVKYCGASFEAETPREAVLRRRYIRAISRATLIGAVARIMKPGCKLDTMAVFEGPQGALKSSMLRILAVRDEWFSDALPHDLSAKDARQHLAGRWLIEMPEIAQFRKSEIESLKAFLSCPIDVYRPAYGHAVLHVPRQCALFGSTNEDAYLRDTGGNRRFWPVRVLGIDLDSIRANRDQLWAEAVAAWQTDEQWWLSPAIEKIAAQEQGARIETDPWHNFVASYVAKKSRVTTADIMRALDIEDARRSRAEEIRIGGILRVLGMVRRRESGGARTWFYEWPAEETGS